jgi:hypothetical protein
MNLANRLPLGPKPAKSKPNARYLDAVRELPCVICDRTPCEAHHPIHGRFSQVKVPDEMAIPLCADCHRSLHAGKETWAAMFGEDHEYTAATQDRLAHLLNKDRS